MLSRFERRSPNLLGATWVSPFVGDPNMAKMVSSSFTKEKNRNEEVPLEKIHIPCIGNPIDGVPGTWMA